MLHLRISKNLLFIWQDLLNKRSRKLAIESVTLAVLGALLTIAAPYGISVFIEGLSGGSVDLLILGGTVFVILQLSEVLIGYVRSRHREYFFQESFWHIPQAITRLSFNRPLSWLAGTSSDIDGGGIESLRDKTWSVIGSFIFAIIPTYGLTAFGLAACFVAHPAIGAVALAYTLVELKLGQVNNSYIHREMKPVIDQFKRADRRRSEWWRNLDHIKSSGVETKILSYIFSEVQEALKGDDAVWRIYFAKWLALRRMISLAFAVPVYGITGYLVIVTGDVSNALGVLVFFSFQRVRNSLGELSDQQREVQFNLVSIAKYRRALKRTVPFVYNEGKSFDEEHVSIAFNGVSHEVGEGDKRGLVLRDVNLNISVGERVGIVGPSGAGKSQLMSLLVRANDPAQGSITISGTDLREWDLETLLRYYGVIMQKSEPYEDSVLGNALFGVSHLDLPCSYDDLPKHKQTELLSKAHAALKKSGLDVNEFSEGIMTNIGYKGTRLSGGQQQRLQIAGAHLKLSLSAQRPRFILADEPTASLDSLSEVTVMGHLRDLPPNTTMCMVAHRLSTVEDMDRIVFVRPLSACDKDTQQVTVHDSLTELYETDALFREMADAQKFVPKGIMQAA